MTPTILIAFTVNSPSCFGQKTSKGPLQPSSQATATCSLHAVEASLCLCLLLNVMQANREYVLNSLVWPDRESSQGLPDIRITQKI